MATIDRLNLITRNTEEVLTTEDLRNFLRNEFPLKHYIGFEISGMIHLGTGIMSMMKVRDFMAAGVDCTVFLADWHTWINDKLGGDREIIKKVAVGYFKEGMKASLKCVGGNPNKLNFILGSDLYHDNDTYWSSLIDVAKNITLARNLRSISIMGRKEGEGVDFAKLIYPPMQVNDIFNMEINMAHAGMDQRKAHVLARDAASNLKIKPLLNPKGNQIKPIAVHHHLILGLQKPPVWPLPKENREELVSALKMSKSVPDSAIFIHDSPEEIKRKIDKAFCPPEEVEFNPIIDWIEHLILNEEKEFMIEREEKFGGTISFKAAEELRRKYLEGKIHPQDLKAATAKYLIDLLEPARAHFSEEPAKSMLADLEKLVG